MKTVPATLPIPLEKVLLEHQPLAVLISGGCDSEVLLRAACRALGPDAVLALTADTPLLPRRALGRASDLARGLRVPHILMPLDLLALPAVAMNTRERCYRCKEAIYREARRRTAAVGYTHLADGTHADDLQKDRPGLRAAREENILHPLALAGMTKAHVRRLGEALGIPDPLRPEDSCLATRLEGNEPVLPGLLQLVETLESPMKPRLKDRLRARISGSLVILEYRPPDAETVMEHLDRLRTVAERAGFTLRISTTEGSDVQEP